jgi:hypothetical protein
VLPGGRNSGQKAQKGPRKKKLAEEFVAENWPNFFQDWPNFFHVPAEKYFGTWQHWQQQTHSNS